MYEYEYERHRNICGLHLKLFENSYYSYEFLIGISGHSTGQELFSDEGRDCYWELEIFIKPSAALPLLIIHPHNCVTTSTLYMPAIQLTRIASFAACNTLHDARHPRLPRKQVVGNRQAHISQCQAGAASSTAYENNIPNGATSQQPHTMA